MRGLLYRRGAWKAALFCGSALAAGAHAAEEVKPPSAEVSEVIVTANKRPERILDVPYAITAVGAREISERGARDIKDLQYSIPGLQINATTPGQDRIQLRGVNAGTGTGLPVVAIYVDEVGISIDQQQREASFPLVDVDRIEVLRGPQGTLYGQGSVAGTIRYITKDPDLTKSTGFVEANGYTQDQGSGGGRLNAAVGIPLINDVLAVRLVAGYDHQGGWIDYPNAGKKDANNIDSSFVRGKLLFKPNEKLTASLLYQHSLIDGDTNNYSTDFSVGTNRSPLLTPFKDENDLVNGIVHYDLGFATLTGSIGYQNRHLTSVGVAFPLNTVLPGANGDTRYEQTTEELRLTSSTPGRFHYTIGVWHRDFESSAKTIRNLVLVQTGTAPVNSEATAVFGDATYDLTKSLEASVGLRYYTDQRESNTQPVVGTYKHYTSEANALSPRFNLRYKWTNDISSYATASKGFRSGGFNSVIPPATTPTTFSPESLWNYEVGSKAKLFNGRLFVDAAVYYVDYKNRQASSPVVICTPPAVAPNCPTFSITTNGGAAEGAGIELAATAVLPYDLRLNVTGSYNDVRYTSRTAETNPGDRFGYVPPATASVSLSKYFPIKNDLAGFWRIDYQHADRYRNILRFVTSAGVPSIRGIERVAASDTLNLRAGVDYKKLTLALEIRNLWNEDNTLFPFTTLLPSVAIDSVAAKVPPRTVGLTLSYRFD